MLNGARENVIICEVKMEMALFNNVMLHTAPYIYVLNSYYIFSHCRDINSVLAVRKMLLLDDDRCLC